VQRLVKGERVVDGRRGAQVTRCQDEAAVPAMSAIALSSHDIWGTRLPWARTKGR
jgi:hypothetical protein